MSGRIVKLRSSDNIKVEIELGLFAKHSRNILKIMAEKPRDKSGCVLISEVNGFTLQSVATWCVDHRDDPPEDDEQDYRIYMFDDLPPHEEDFFVVDQAKLCELLKAALYFDIRPLKYAACKTVANLIEGNSPEKIRQIFNLKNDFLPGEELLVRQLHTWKNG